MKFIHIFLVTLTIILIINNVKCTINYSDEKLNKDENIIIKIFHSLYSILRYLNENKSKMIFDSTIGIQITIDQVTNLIDRTTGIKKNILHILMNESTKLSKESLEYIIKSDPNNYKSK